LFSFNSAPYEQSYTHKGHKYQAEAKRDSKVKKDRPALPKPYFNQLQSLHCCKLQGRGAGSANQESKIEVKTFSPAALSLDSCQLEAWWELVCIVLIA
jgi:hypothetical protein